MKLLGNRVLIKPDEVGGEQITHSGIIIPPAANKKEVPSMGVIVAIAPGKWGARVGDRVIFAKFDLDVIDLEGVEHRIGDIEHVLAVVQ